MQKIVKKYGNAHVLRLDPEDLEIYKLKEGDIVEVELRKIKK